MPTYEYECKSCPHRFEKRQSFSDAPIAECPRCQGSSRRVFHPTPIIFKGSGFYVTDSRKPADSGGDGSGGAGASDDGAEKPSSQEGSADKEKTPAREESSGTEK